MIRPELRAALTRWREVLVGAAVAAAGLGWMQATDSGFFQALAGGVALVGAALSWIGYRRLRFAGGAEGPGIVQVVEGQISYFGPFQGGFIALRDLDEVHLIDHGRAWMLVPRDDLPVTIPVGATGAAALFDAFASLPGMDMQALIRARDATDPPSAQLLWTHPRRARDHPALT